MFLKVIEPHRPSYPDPAQFKAGDVLRLGGRDYEYPGWIWVKTDDGGQGWAPLKYIDISGDAPTAKRDYSARELDTEVGDVVELLETLNGWVWVRDYRRECGWIPVSTTVPA